MGRDCDCRVLFSVAKMSLSHTSYMYVDDDFGEKINSHKLPLPLAVPVKLVHHTRVTKVYTVRVFYKLCSLAGADLAYYTFCKFYKTES